MVAGLLGGNLRALNKLNIPSEEEYVAAYCRGTGREEVPQLDFYVAFNFFRLAAICHGIKGSLARRTAASARAREYADGAGWLAELAWMQAQSATGTRRLAAARWIGRLTGMQVKHACFVPRNIGGPDGRNHG